MTDRKRFGKNILTAVILVIVMLASTACGSGGGGYKAPFESIVKEINKGEKFDYLNLMKRIYQI